METGSHLTQAVVCPSMHCHTPACFHPSICRQLQKSDTLVALLFGREGGEAGHRPLWLHSGTSRVPASPSIPLRTGAPLCSLPISLSPFSLLLGSGPSYAIFQLLLFAQRGLHHFVPPYIPSPVTYFILSSQPEVLLRCAFNPQHLLSHLCVLPPRVLHPLPAGSTNPSHLCQQPL